MAYPRTSVPESPSVCSILHLLGMLLETRNHQGTRVLEASSHQGIAPTIRKQQRQTIINVLQLPTCSVSWTASSPAIPEIRRHKRLPVLLVSLEACYYPRKPEVCYHPKLPVLPKILEVYYHQAPSDY